MNGQFNKHILYLVGKFQLNPMNRRKFIKNTALAATLVGISPSMAAGYEKKKAKQIIFVWRGVAYADALNAFKKASFPGDLSFHIQKTTCLNTSYSHQEGLQQLLEGLACKHEVVETQLSDRFLIPQVIEDAFSGKASTQQVIYLHHSEIAHSSNKIYIERLEEFFTELAKTYTRLKSTQKVIITADIGRNEKNNSCGGRDHSNTTCLETFALYLGGHAATLAENQGELSQVKVLGQKF
jgi:uncharacterized protein (DUF1501 family)